MSSSARAHAAGTGSTAGPGGPAAAAAAAPSRYSVAQDTPVLKDEKAADWHEPDSSIARGANQDERNAFVEPSAKNFNVRGPNYLEDRKKVAAEFRAMELLGVDLLRSESLEEHVCARGAKAKCAHMRGGGGDVFCINFQLPGKPGFLSLLLVTTGELKDPSWGSP